MLTGTKTRNMTISKVKLRTRAAVAFALLGLAAAPASAILTDRIAVWGNNSSGQCSFPAGIAGQIAAIDAGNDYSMLLKKDGTVVIAGGVAGMSPPSGLANVTAMSAGWNTLAALRGGAELLRRTESACGL